MALKMHVTANGTGTVCVRFGKDSFSLVLTDKELEQSMSREKWNGSWGFLCYDIARIVAIEGYRLRIISADNAPCDIASLDYTYQDKVRVYLMDTAKFCKALLTLSQKNKNLPEERKIKCEWSLDRFACPSEQSVPILPIVQIVKNPNAQGRFSETVANFRRKISTEHWARLMRDLSHYVKCAKIWGEVSEFYFDGRHVAGGCGFNGGIILDERSASYSIHT